MHVEEATRELTRDALIKRCNRRLKPQGLMLKTRRGRLDPMMARHDMLMGRLGRYYVLDYNRNPIVRPSVDVEAFARELGVLHELEHLEAA